MERCYERRAVADSLQGQRQREEKGAKHSSGNHVYFKGYLKKRNYNVIVENLTLDSNGP